MTKKRLDDTYLEQYGDIKERGKWVVDRNFLASLKRGYRSDVKESLADNRDICGADERSYKTGVRIRFVEAVLENEVYAELHQPGIFKVISHDGEIFYFAPKAGKWQNKTRRKWYKAKSVDHFLKNFVKKEI